MSTIASANDLEYLTFAIQNVRADAEGVHRHAWVLVGHVDNNPNLIDVVGQGENMDDFISRLEDDQVMYALLRFMVTFDMSSTVKFVYVRW